jgi:hypothetical protein
MDTPQTIVQSPVEFRDLVWTNIHPDLLLASERLFEWLQQIKDSPLSLKDQTRLAVREILFRHCFKCWLDQNGQDFEEGSRLEQIVRKTPLPRQLQDFLLFKKK